MNGTPMGRGRKALRNVTTGLVNKALLMLLSFATRTVFIRLLGAEYTGVSSLYGNILSVLSLAELGVGNVMMFYLYAALKRGDEGEIAALVGEFRRIYRGIAACVLGVGLALVPFLPYILNSELNRQELTLYYLLYLFNSAASYFVVYRTTVLGADQRGYLSNITGTVMTAVKYALQIGYLLLFRNFLGYLLIELGTTVAGNLILNGIALHAYPYLRHLPRGTPDRAFRRDLFRNVKATFLFKVSDTVLDQTDSILISLFFGARAVGYYTNYFLIVRYLTNIGGIIASGMTSSFGSLNAEGDPDRSRRMFDCLRLLFSVMAAYCIACFAAVVQDFIPIWIGAEYRMGPDLIAALLLVFYVRMVMNPVTIYRATLGLFREVQYINLIAAALNLVLSVLMGLRFGTAGIVAATALARLASSFWYEGRAVCRRLAIAPRTWLIGQLCDLLRTAAIAALSLLCCAFVPLSGIPAIAVKLVICTLITGALELAFHARSEAFRTLLQQLGRLRNRG